MRLTDRHISILCCTLGRTVDDVPKIQAAMNNARYTVRRTQSAKGKKITAEEAAEMLGDEAFLSALAGTVSDGTTEVRTPDGRHIVKLDLSGTGKK
ncbi:MAG: hypothetical protein IJ504_00650 [Bacteroidales bacterium]|nr:hypothetical protein [Bacteroidales bacterium]